MSGLEDEEQKLPYTKLGEEKEPHHPKNVYLLILDEWLKTIDPKDYYLTSGEAIRKMEALIADMQDQLKSAKELYQLLVDTRGRDKFLETEADKMGVIIKIKNPRSAKAKPRKIRTDIPDVSGIISFGDKLYSKPAKKENVVSYCAINPDTEKYAYFNAYANKIDKDKIKFKHLSKDWKAFEKSLKSRGYKKVLI